MGWSWRDDTASEPWEFQFGVEYSDPEPSGIKGSPFAAMNARLRQEVDFGGLFTVEAGWQWRGEAGHLFRTGVVYNNGMDEQFQFYRQYESAVGLCVWYDF